MSEWGSEELQAFISSYCRNRISTIQSQCDQADLDNQKLRREVEATVSDWNEYVRSKLSLQLDAQVSDNLMGVITEALKIVPLSDSYTGIVVAGFGKDQHFPALSHYVVDDVLGERRQGLSKAKYLSRY